MSPDVRKARRLSENATVFELLDMIAWYRVCLEGKHIPALWDHLPVEPTNDSINLASFESARRVDEAQAGYESAMRELRARLNDGRIALPSEADRP